jgi:hypothetical protein
MSNVIDFLERMGQDADLQHVSTEALALHLDEHSLDIEARTAILNGDAEALSSIVGARHKLVCMVYPMQGTH